MSDKLAVLSDVERQLASVETVDEAKAIRDRAEAIRIYAKSARLGLAIQNRAASVKIGAERRAGALLKGIERSKGGRGKTTASLARVYKEQGIAPRTGEQWQTMASVPDAEVKGLEAKLTEAERELTSAAVFRLGRAQAVQPPPAPVVTPGWPDGPFRAMVIDPPWPVEKIVLDRRPVERERMDYPTWPLDRIRDEIPIPRLADARGTHVYLWVTHRFLPFGLECFATWGVRYECLLTWIKPTAQPLWWKFNTEHILFGKIGALAPLTKGISVGFTAPQQRHSHKPEEFFALVRSVSPEPRCTLFDEARDGFLSWGISHVG